MLSRADVVTGGRAAALWGGTFHSVANRILRHNAAAIGYPADFTILDAEDQRLLMTRFYHNLLSGMDKYESLKEAQRYVRDYAVTVEVKPDVRPAISAAAREEARKRRQAEKEYKTVQKYRDPYYWAGFILLDAR